MSEKAPERPRPLLHFSLGCGTHMPGTHCPGQYWPNPKELQEAIEDEADRMDLLVEHVPLPTDESPYDRIRRTWSLGDFQRKTTKLRKERAAESKEQPSRAQKTTPSYNMDNLLKMDTWNAKEVRFATGIPRSSLYRMPKEVRSKTKGRFLRKAIQRIMGSE